MELQQTENRYPTIRDCKYNINQVCGFADVGNQKPLYLNQSRRTCIQKLLLKIRKKKKPLTRICLCYTFTVSMNVLHGYNLHISGFFYVKKKTMEKIELQTFLTICCYNINYYLTKLKENLLRLQQIKCFPAKK